MKGIDEPHNHKIELHNLEMSPTLHKSLELSCLPAVNNTGEQNVKFVRMYHCVQENLWGFS